ncbi:hypothetical protein C8R46DRAFT_1038884 [Mycena filopes]|nr:hypothetical protein C8R46DRAFT_1038884 [Mycena filopes]
MSLPTFVSLFTVVAVLLGFAQAIPKNFTVDDTDPRMLYAGNTTFQCVGGCFTVPWDVVRLNGGTVTVTQPDTVILLHFFGTAVYVYFAAAEDDATSTQNAVFLVDGDSTTQKVVNMTFPPSQTGTYNALAYSHTMNPGEHVLTIAEGPFDIDYLLVTQVSVCLRDFLSYDDDGTTAPPSTSSIPPPPTPSPTSAATSSSVPTTSPMLLSSTVSTSTSSSGSFSGSPTPVGDTTPVRQLSYLASSPHSYYVDVRETVSPPHMNPRKIWIRCQPRHMPPPLNFLAALPLLPLQKHYRSKALTFDDEE